MSRGGRELVTLQWSDGLCFFYNSYHIREMFVRINFFDHILCATPPLFETPLKYKDEKTLKASSRYGKIHG